MIDAQRVLRFLRPEAIPNEDYFASGAMFVWVGPGVAPTPEEVAAAELPAAKAATIAANRAECERRIFARYPAGRQLSALAGMYDSANVQNMHDWISLMIAAENAAADAIDAATTIAEVEAVTVAWPV